MKRPSFLILLSMLVLQAAAQKVIFPQRQQAGEAVLSVLSPSEGTNYVLSNDLLSASFVHADGQLTFGGCEAMGLLPSANLFSVRLASGSEVPSSQMRLLSVETEELAADASAAKGALKLPGKSVKATFRHGSLAITWRAVLRDGSHYLRTELELTGKANVAMNAVVPMHYTVRTDESGQMPEVVGNTRGAVIASDRIFAGLETPMGKNSVAGATEISGLDYGSWTSSTFSWEPAAQTPEGILSLMDIQNLVRRDQIYFVNKDHRTGESELYSLSDFNGVRKDTKVMDAYLFGRFDAVPNMISPRRKIR